MVSVLRRVADLVRLLLMLLLSPMLLFALLVSERRARGTGGTATLAAIANAYTVGAVTEQLLLMAPVTGFAIDTFGHSALWKGRRV